MTSLAEIVSFVVILAQEPEPTTTSPFSFLGSPILPFVVIGVLFYMLMIRPERRKRAETTNMLSNLKLKSRPIIEASDRT